MDLLQLIKKRFDSEDLVEHLQTLMNVINPDTYGVKKVVVDVKERKKKA